MPLNRGRGLTPISMSRREKVWLPSPELRATGSRAQNATLETIPVGHNRRDGVQLIEKAQA